MLPCPGYSDEELIHLVLARELSALSERPAGRTRDEETGGAG